MIDDKKDYSSSNSVWSPTKVIIITFLFIVFIFFIIDSFTTQYSLHAISYLMKILASYNILSMTVLFLIFTAVSLVFVFPTGLLCLAGGYIYAFKLGFTIGLIISTIINLIGNVLGCFLTFKISMFLTNMSNSTMKKSDYHPYLWGIRKALEKKGLLINILLRLTPIVPSAIINYTLPPLGTKLYDFLIGTFLGTIPYAFVLSFLGSMVSDSTSVQGYVLETSLWISLPLGFLAVMSLITSVYLLYSYVNEALQTAIRENNDELDDEDDARLLMINKRDLHLVVDESV